MTTFKIHTVETAPEKSREILKAVQGKMGFVPNMVGEMAEAPVALKGWVDLKATLDTGHLSAVEREIVQITVSWLNDCGYCVAAHSTLALQAHMPADVIEALRHDKPLKDAKLEALRVFTKAVMKRLGRADDADIKAFLAAGYAEAHILEVVMNISAAIMTNYVNHIARTPLDKHFEGQRIEEGRVEARRSDAA